MACTFVPDPPSGTFEAGVGMWEGAPNTDQPVADIAVSADGAHSGLLGLEVSTSIERNGVGAWLRPLSLPAIMGTEARVGSWGQIVVGLWYFLPASSALSYLLLAVSTHATDNYADGLATSSSSEGSEVGTWSEVSTTCSLTADSAYFQVAVVAAAAEPPTGTGVSPPGTRFYIDDVCYVGKTLLDQPPPAVGAAGFCPEQPVAVASPGQARLITQSPVIVRLTSGATVIAVGT